MGFRSAHLNRSSSLGLCLVIAARLSAQGQTEAPREQTPEEVAALRATITDALDRKLFTEERDEIYILAMRHSNILVPEVASRIQAALADQAFGDEKFVARLADILAYAADETAIDALTQLCAQGEGRFSYYIGRVLDYSGGRRNPYGLAYYALRKANPQVEASVMKWIDGRPVFVSLPTRLAQALFERYKGMPSESELLGDPVVSRLQNGLPPEVRSELIAVAKEVQARRENR